MRNISQSVVLITLIALQALAQQRGIPRFDDHPVSEVFKRKPAKLKLISRDSRMFRTMLRKNAEKGINFAGHYILATWWCGSDCVSLALIDALTGNVYFTPTLRFIGGFGYALGEDRLQFRRDSRLLITVGKPNDEGYVGKRYWVWKNNRFKLVHIIEDKEFRR